MYVNTYSQCNWQCFVGPSSKHKRSGISPPCILRVLISPDYGRHRRVNFEILRGRVVTTLSLFDFVPSMPGFDPYQSTCQSTSQYKYGKTNRVHHILYLKDWDILLCKSLKKKKAYIIVHMYINSVYIYIYVRGQNTIVVSCEKSPF